VSVQRTFLAVLVFALAVSLVWVVFFWESAPPSGHARLGMAELGTPPSGGGFTLESADGPVSLEDLRGRALLLYFGYTYCPDICPSALAYISAAFSTLSEDELARVGGVFISVDPQRDTPERLKQYAEHFHPQILGLTADPTTIAEVAGRYGAAYHMVDSGSAAGYLVDHSSYTYVIDPQGRLREILPHGTPPGELVHAIRAAVLDTKDSLSN
jgi:protein SCO1